jgi:hypothetical protein
MVKLKDILHEANGESRIYIAETAFIGTKMLFPAHQIFASNP